MARIRYIKPDFFTDEVLAGLSPIHRLTFAGLWCYADKAGRLEYRPQYLKAMLFPYEKVDMEKILNDLSNPKPFIIIYTINGKSYIQITNWSKHQKPHHTEKESVLPPIPPLKGMGMENQLEASLTLNNGEITVKEEKGCKNKKKEPKVFVPPQQKEVIAYFLEKGFSKDLAIRAFEYYENGNPPWTDAKQRPVVSWRQKMLANWMKPENKTSGNAVTEKNRGFDPDTCEVFDFE